MKLVLRQDFPLGRFHATPWRVNPFDDPHGEWPPSPWRFVRAVTARWYQWARETEEELDLAGLEQLQAALCKSTYSFHLPADARKGNPLRQYHPTEFGWRPAEKKKAGIRSYGTSLVQDNYWCVPPESPVWWFIDGDAWTDDLRTLLDQCLERMTYFGRAETLTRIRIEVPNGDVTPNCSLLDKRTAGTVPVLSPLPSATCEDIERTTDNPEAVKRSVPPGSQWLYAARPQRTGSHERSRVPSYRPDCHLIQFAIGWNVKPELRVVARLTARFRGAVIRDLCLVKTDGKATSWGEANKSVRESMENMLGKDSNGSPLTGPHRHTEFLAWCEDDKPTRILAWRPGRAFDEEEQSAILSAASRDLSWAAAGSDADEWKVRLIPLDRTFPPPPGFDGNPARCWESVTPYVPPRHHLRGGKMREREAISEQVRRELELRGFGSAKEVEIEQVDDPEWIGVHVPRTQAARRAFIGDRRGYWLRVTFPEPVKGPICLGHSSHFGLGLFAPADP